MKKSNVLLALVLLAQLLSAQERTVSGIVNDSIGVLPGANVTVKGTNKAAQTDFYGNYAIKAKPNDTLIASFTGYKTKKVAASKTEMNITLQEGIRLKEIAAPAYYPRLKTKTSPAVELAGKVNTAVEQPKIQFEKLSYDFGEIEKGTRLKKEIRFTNIGNKPLIIDCAQTAEGAGVTESPSEPIMPGKSGTIYYYRDTSLVGKFTKTITVKTNDPLQEIIIITVKGVIVAPQ